LDIINRYWITFGVDDPKSKGILPITVEVNPPLEGVNRQCAGFFAEDEGGGVYYCHTGKVGGGRKGIGQSAFVDFYRGDFHEVRWSDGKTTQGIAIGRLNDPNLPALLAAFVREVDAFKTIAVTKTAEVKSRSILSDRFRPEFSGKKAHSCMRRSVDASCYHGVVVNTLANALQTKDKHVGNDQNRDLYILNQTKTNMTHLFEAKTDLNTSSVYQAVGQLMLNGATQDTMPVLVAVLPGSPAIRTAAILHRLGIRILTYSLIGDRATFCDLDRIL
jgi:hypothetical protein